LVPFEQRQLAANVWWCESGRLEKGNLKSSFPGHRLNVPLNDKSWVRGKALRKSLCGLKF
jgi:hypothetical protein